MAGSSHSLAQRRFEFDLRQDQPRSARLNYLHDGAVSLSLEGERQPQLAC